MANVSEKGLKSGGFNPNIYIRKIVLNTGGAVDSRRPGDVDRSAPISEFRRQDGSLVYQPRTQQKTTDGSGATKVALHLQVKDIVNANTRQSSWLTDLNGRARTLGYVLQSTNPRLTAELISGSYMDQLPVRIPENYNKLVDYDIIEFSLAKTPNDRTMPSVNTSTGNTIVSLNKEVQFNVPQENPDHLTYFVMMQKMPSQTRQRTTNTHSMIVVEKVFDNSLPVDSSFVYKDTQNSIWSGPVHHNADQGWMEGALHGNWQHDTLSRHSVSNFKLQDARIFSRIEGYKLSLGAPKGNRNTFVSDLLVSKNKDGTASLVFTVDHLSYMASHSKFGKLYSDSSPALQSQLLKESKILELSMARQRVSPRVALNEAESGRGLLGGLRGEGPLEVFALSADRGGILQNRRRYTLKGEGFNKSANLEADQPVPSGYQLGGSIREIRVDRGAKLRTFAVADGEISRITDGKYQYGVRVEFKDGAFPYLQSKLSELRKTIALMTSYLAVAEKRPNHLALTGEFSPSFARSQASTLRTIPVWMGSISVFMEALDLLTDIQGGEKTAIAKSLYSLISPELGTLDNLRAFISSMERFGEKFEKLIGASRSFHAEGRSSIGQSTATSNLKMETKFSNIIDSNSSKGTGFDYFGLGALSSPGPRTITPQQLKERIDTELARYEGNLYDASELVNDFSFMTAPGASALTSEATRYSYLAPAFFELSDTSINLLSENKDGLDCASVTAVIQEVLSSPTNRALDVTPNRRTLGLLRKGGTGPTTERLEELSDVYATVAADGGVIVNEPLSDPIVESARVRRSTPRTNSSDGYLGGSNAFATSTDPLQPTTTQEPSPRLANSLSVLKDLFKLKTESGKNTEPIRTTSLNEISFDLSRPDNFINKRVRANAQLVALSSANASVTNTLQNLPTQIKLLTRNKNRVYDDSSFRMSAGTDAQTDAFIYNFAMIRVVEYMFGYEQGDMKRPIWKRLDTRTLDTMRKGLICRIKRYVDPNTNIGAFEGLDAVPVYDEIFILAPGDASPRRSTATFPKVVLKEAAILQGFPKKDFTSGPRRATTRRLVSLEREKKSLEGSVEYLSSEVPGAPTSLRGRTSGLPRASRPDSSTVASTPELGARSRIRRRNGGY